MDTFTKDYPRGNLRVSDADRDRAVAELSEAFQVGRLTAEEFDERSGKALSATTETDLAGLLADLPRAAAAMGDGVPGSVCPGARDRVPAGWVAPSVAVAVLVVACAAVVVGGYVHAALASVPIPLLVVALIAFRRLFRSAR